MMEGILTQRVTPLLKCIVLFLFIFTAKVLTSRPHESQDHRNSIHHPKPSHYVRTFTKYHHRRTIQWNNLHELYWPSNDFPKSKRSVDAQSYWSEKGDQEKAQYPWPVQPMNNRRKRSIPYSNFISNHEVQSHKMIPRIRKRNVRVINDFQSLETKPLALFVDSELGSHEAKAIASSTSGKGSSNVKNGLNTNLLTKDKNVATAIPTIQCFYKVEKVSISVTPSYEDEKNAQMMVENNNHDIGTITETHLPNGEIASVENCTDSKATCYTLWHRHQDGNITILGQGCWHSSQRNGQNTCDKCTPIDQMQGTRFCCCTKSYCNADFLSLREETVTIKAESTMNTVQPGPNYSHVAASVILAIAAILVTVALIRKLYCNRSVPDKQEMSLPGQAEKSDVMGTGPDALATGLLCVDNLTLIEHIGQGKFGSVWRGSLGSIPVAVKLYSNANAWQKEAGIYALPHLSHPNILKYYGSDTRASLTDCGRSRLVVLELCLETLRDRLQRTPLAWREYAAIAHGIAAALAHLHAPVGNKPCIVHRDVNSNNVLITSTGQARLADLGLAQVLHARREKQPSRITEAGTLRYLSPEALEGALDLSGARAALCAVDVFALGLVLWEALWRCNGAYIGPVPAYMQPYGHLLPARPTLQQMQTLVSRNKVRPPLPKGPVPEARALKIASDTCEECWDHDAEARLTAVCVEERMAELKQMLQAQGPVIHDNKLHPHPPDTNIPEMDKNSNCTSGQTSDPTAPLLTRPQFGRNACIERNTNTNIQTHTVQLIHKSLKDITTPEVKPQRVEENCLSVARTHRVIVPESSDRLNEIRSYQRPLEYIPNDVTSHNDRGPKRTNLLQEVKVEKPKWGIRKFFERLNKKMDTEVKLMPETSTQNGKTKTSIIEKCNNFDRPSNLVLNQDSIYNIEGPCTLSPPNRTLSPTMMIESEMNRENNVFGFRELPNEDAKNQSQIFAVIVPKAQPDAESHSKTNKSSDDSINKFKGSVSSQSIFKNHSESEDSTVKKRLSCDNKIIHNSGRSSRASINLELQYINNQTDAFDSPFDMNSECSSSEDEHLMLLSENGGSKITMQAIPKEIDKKKFQNDVLKEASQVTDFGFNKFQNKYTNFDNEFSYSNDKENLGYSGDNPVYLAALNGEIDTADVKFLGEPEEITPKPFLKSLSIKRQRSLEQVSEIFSSSGDLNLQNPAGRVKTPGDLPVAVRRARRDRALQKGRASESNRLSLYDDRMMFGNSL
ncbi:hypothetical protein evm_001747 [Chilo suppressalis]|nr:hypothetical protein evm_001747 [Chilo suppressalis]